MTDQALAAGWDADQRLAAIVSFISGSVVVVGTALTVKVAAGPTSHTRAEPASPTRSTTLAQPATETASVLESV